MQFIDLAAQQKRIKEKLDRNIQTVLAHGRYILGPEVRKLEERLAAYTGVKHAIGCASGTDALLMALMACDVGPGDAVFTSPFTFIATAEVISFLGATPVFVDIDPETFNIDPAKLEKAIKAVKDNDPQFHPLPAANNQSSASLPRRSFSEDGSSLLTPRGVIAVDLFGLPADYEHIEDIARKHGLLVVEDAAQSFGAELNGQKACSFGTVACTSFFPAKPLGCYGDGGMCFTDDDKLAGLLDSLRVHGKGHDKYDNVRIGLNGRLDTLQAGILLAKFDIFPQEMELRQQVAERYTKLLDAYSYIKAPVIPENYKSVWAQYSILANDKQHRTGLQNDLKAAGIPTAVYYPKPLHLQTAFRFLGYQRGAFPVSEECAERIFSLPMHPYLSEEQQREVTGVLGSFK